MKFHKADNLSVCWVLVKTKLFPPSFCNILAAACAHASQLWSRQLMKTLWYFFPLQLLKKYISTWKEGYLYGWIGNLTMFLKISVPSVKHVKSVKERATHLFVCLSSVCPYVCPSVCLTDWLPVDTCMRSFERVLLTKYFFAAILTK